MQILKVIFRVGLLGEMFEVSKLHIFSKFRKTREQSTLEIVNTCILSNQKFLCLRYTSYFPPSVSVAILDLFWSYEKIKNVGKIFDIKFNQNNVKYMFLNSGWNKVIPL